MNISALLFATLSVHQATPPSQALELNPLLIYQAAEVWSVIAKKDNPVWPGWDASSTPLLIYFPGKQDLLINHPKPPEGFKLWKPPIPLPFKTFHIQTGKTLIEYDGQNTAIEVNGVQTLVVADTLSTRRQNVESLVSQARGSTDDMKESIDGSLWSNPFDSMLMFAHEAFHVYQQGRAPEKGGNERDLASYPSLSVENNVAVALESEMLIEALNATSDEGIRRAAVKWLALRKDRRKALDPKLAAYEDGTEFNEGTAKYVEYKMLEVFRGKKPLRELWLTQGYQGYDNLEAERQRLLKSMVNIMSGKTNINNDPYGASPVRMRLYFSGMGIGGLLDRLHFKWHDRIFEKTTSLTSLAEEALKANPQDLDAALKEIKSSTRYRELTAEKEKLAKDGLVYVQQMLDSFDKAPGTLVLDYSGLAKPRVGLGFTPFGLLHVDNARTIYRLLPMRGIVNDLRFAQDSANPILQDNDKKQMVLMLREGVNEAYLDKALGSADWRTKAVNVKELKLPGVTLTNLNGKIRIEGKQVIVSPN